MFNKHLYIFSAFIINLFLLTPVWGVNFLHNPEEIFEKHPSGSRVPSPLKTTHADVLHSQGITGEGTLAVIIDDSFNPNWTKLLQQKGVIHPDALEPDNPYILTSEDMTYEDVLHREFKTTEEIIAYNTEKNDNNSRLKRRDMCDMLNGPDEDNHGSGVMEAIHTMAPGAMLFPVDLNLVCQEHDSSLTRGQAYAKILRDIIKKKPNVINLSNRIPLQYQESFDVLVDAIESGIPVVMAAGNGSLDTYRSERISECFALAGAPRRKSEQQELFESTGQKGVYFAGSLGYEETGEERVSGFSQLPDADKTNAFMLADGENLSFHTKNNPECIDEGTSVSAGILSGGMLLMEQYCKQKEYNYKSPDDLFNLLKEGGRRVTYGILNKGQVDHEEDYKALDVLEASKVADKMFNA